MGRILGIDYGERWVGFAISDPQKIIATPLMEIDLRKKNLYNELEKVFEEYEIERIVIGLPLTLSEKKTPLYEKVNYVKKKIEMLFKKEVKLFDERYTTKLGKIYLDKESHKISAAYLLQDYINSLKYR